LRLLLVGEARNPGKLLPGPRLTISGTPALVAALPLVPARLIEARLVQTGLVQAGQIWRPIARWVIRVVAARAGLEVAVRRAASARLIVWIAIGTTLRARIRLTARPANSWIARWVGVAPLAAGHAWNATRAAGSDGQVRIGAQPGLTGRHASTQPAHAHGGHALGLRLPMVENEFPLVKIVAPLVELDASFFDLAGDTRDTTRHAGTLLLPVSLEPGQATGSRLGQQIADDTGSLTAGAQLTESHRLAASGAGESSLLSPLLVAAGLVEACSPGS